MEWKGEQLKTIGDIMKKGIEQCNTPEEAQEFMELYRAANEHADVNIGYLSGYYDSEYAAHVREWFAVTHPIFGNRYATSEEAFTKGLELGQAR